MKLKICNNCPILETHYETNKPMCRLSFDIDYPVFEHEINGCTKTLICSSECRLKHIRYLDEMQYLTIEPETLNYGVSNKMNQKQFNEFFNQMCKEEYELLNNKGREYSGNDNRFSNFQRLGREINQRPEMVLYVYLKKHLDSIASYIREGEVFSNETIFGRISDARNYLALLAGIIYEKEMESESE